MPANPFDSGDRALLDVATRAPGPAGTLPFTSEMLRERPSGDLFGWTQNAGMGWEPSAMAGREFLILSTHGGIRAPDGTPIALGYHTGHWEVGLLMEAAAREFKAAGAIPFAGACTDPCDGRSQGTPAMFDSLAYRNDAATVFRRLIRSLPTRSGVLGVATCDKGLPAMMMALASMHDLPCVLVPGGVTLLPVEGEDAARIQTIGVRYVHGEITLQDAADLGCRACASPGGGCQFLGTAATVAGRRRSAGHDARPRRTRPFRTSDLARHGHAVGGRADASRERAASRMRDILTGRRAPQRDGHPRRVRRIDEPDSAPPGYRPCRGPAPAHRRGLDRRQPASAAPRRRAAERAEAPSDHPGVPGRRRARGDAASPPRRAARHGSA